MPDDRIREAGILDPAVSRGHVDVEGMRSPPRLRRPALLACLCASLIGATAHLIQASPIYIVVAGALGIGALSIAVLARA